MAQVGWFDHVHRAFSWGVLLLAVVLLIRLRRTALAIPIGLSRFILGLVVAQMIFGAVLAYGGLPAPFKILHLAAATLMISAEFLLLLETRGSRAQAGLESSQPVPST